MAAISGTGDLIATGTVSGETRDSWGCLLELTQGGTDPIELPSGESRRFLQDGDEVIMRGLLPARGICAYWLWRDAGVSCSRLQSSNSSGNRGRMQRASKDGIDWSFFAA